MTWAVMLLVSVCLLCHDALWGEYKYARARSLVTNVFGVLACILFVAILVRGQ